MPAVVLPPLPFFTALDSAGVTIMGAKIETYLAGTSTPAVVYTDSTGNTAHPNPVVTDPAGRAEIWLAIGTAYKFVIRDAADVLIRTIDGITAPSATVQVTTSTTAGLPAASTLGRLRTLTDGRGGMLLDTGLQWVSVGPIQVNVRNAPHNARGDNSTDDTAAFSSALAAGTSIYVPAGTYRVDQLRPQQQQLLLGDGFGRTIIRARTLGGGAGIENISTSSPVTEVKIQDMSFTDFAIGLDLRGVYYVQAYNVHLLSNTTGVLMGARQSGAPQCIWNTLRHVRMTSTSKDVDFHVLAGVDAGINLNQFEDCQFECTANAVDLDYSGGGGNGPVALAFLGCEFRFGVLLRGCLATNFSHCYFEGNDPQLTLAEATGVHVVANYFNGGPVVFVRLGTVAGGSTVAGLKAHSNRFVSTAVAGTVYAWSNNGDLNASSYGVIGPDALSSAGATFFHLRDTMGRMDEQHGDTVLATSRILYGKTATGTQIKMAELSGSVTQLGDGGAAGAGVRIMPSAFYIPLIATGSLPSAGSSNDQRICIEDVGAGDRNLIIYAGGQRFRLDGGAPF